MGHKQMSPSTPDPLSTLAQRLATLEERSAHYANKTERTDNAIAAQAERLRALESDIHSARTAGRAILALLLAVASFIGWLASSLLGVLQSPK